MILVVESRSFFSLREAKVNALDKSCKKVNEHNKRSYMISPYNIIIRALFHPIWGRPKEFYFKILTKKKTPIKL